MWLCDQMSAAEGRSVLQMINMNAECGAVLRMSHQAFPQAALLLQSWESECVSSAQKPKLNCLPSHICSEHKKTKTNSRNVCCVYIGRAMSEHHAYTKASYSDNIAEAQMNISSVLLILLRVYRSCGVLCSLAARSFPTVLTCSMWISLRDE